MITGDDTIHANDGGRQGLVDCGPGNDTVVLDPRERSGGISDAQMRGRGRVRGCETVVHAPAPAADPARGITWLGPRSGATKRGTSRDDTLLGSTGADIIHGLGGSDAIWGNQLHRDRSRALDRLFGGPGDDTIYGSPGRNTIRGEDGDDYLQGGARRNAIFGGHGDDEIRLRGSGPNRVDAGPGNDTVHSYAQGATTIDCGAGLDTAYVDKDDRAEGCERVIRR